MIDFEHYRDALSKSLDEAYGYISSPQNGVKSALLCVLEAMGEMKNLLDKLAENAKDNSSDVN